jgi:glutamyl-tRNA synthetase
VILGQDGAKLSKRHGDTDALQYRDKGYLPEALVNFLALLGWNEGTEQEIFSQEELADKFSLERIQKSPAKFDLERLNWMNGLFIREKLSEDDYIQLAFAELKRAGLPNTEQARSAVLLERERIKAFAELPKLVDFFFEAPKPDITMINLIAKKVAPDEAQSLLTTAATALKLSANDDVESVETTLRDRAQELNIKPGKFFYVIRCAITGKTAAPGLFETILVLGRNESVKRLQAAAASMER